MCGILPRSFNLHPKRHAYNRQPLTEKTLRSWNKTATYINTRLRSVAENTKWHDLTYLPVHGNFFKDGKPNREMISLDGLHLNRRGHRLLANHILEAVRPIREAYQVGIITFMLTLFNSYSLFLH